MTSMNPRGENRSKELEYLCVDDFIENMFYARALATGFEIGLIDLLIQNKGATFDFIREKFPKDVGGMSLLLDFLLKNRVVENREGTFVLTEEFANALQFRELLETKLQIANFAAHDFLDYFSDLVCDSEQFVHKVRFFRLFSYDKCFDYTEENYALTKRWMRITTALTKYEAQVCMKHHDFGRYSRILDIGGNSGEFVLRICRKYPRIHATVFDLPLVCQVGLEHIQSEPEADRISFVKGNALTDVLPTEFDLISFKSMLHDWPEEEAKQFIARASQSLESGGTLLIFERGPLEVGGTPLSYSMIPTLLFFHYFRSPQIYAEYLKNFGFQNIEIQRIELEMPFYLVTARKR
jgi:ubiquinone/menaquinone biosynthesis C-methylase UbiE